RHGTPVLRRALANLEKMEDVVRLKKWRRTGKIGDAASDIGNLKRHERAFVDTILNKKSNYWVFRTQGGAAKGDLIFVDMSNLSDPLVIIVEAKSKSGGAFAGTQLAASVQLAKKAGFRRVLVFSGTVDEMVRLTDLIQLDDFLRKLKPLKRNWWLK
ncbi:hypothetical protein ACFL5Q_08220, partial [Planctomycetota bacterium]